MVENFKCDILSNFQALTFEVLNLIHLYLTILCYQIQIFNEAAITFISLCIVSITLSKFLEILSCFLGLALAC